MRAKAGSAERLRINATFWGDEPAALAAVAQTAKTDPAEMWAWV